MRLWHRKNKKKANESSRAWRKKNPKRARISARKWYLKNRQLAKLRSRKRHHKNKKVANVRSRRWRIENPSRSKFLLRRWYQKNMEKAKSYGLVRRYGISLDEFLGLKKRQNNKCAICQKRFRRTPYVDHDHKTRKVRGLLCITCNSGLGMLQDSIRVIESAAKYLRRSK